jgi:tetratricopeptide (TPR) repeat protein
VFPFDGHTAEETFGAHLRGQFEPIRTAPPAIAEWVHRLIARSPADRPSSAREALAELGEVTGHSVPIDTQATVASHIQRAPFIPRGDILEELEALSTGRGVRVSFLEGDVGTGKSRLLHELRQRLQLGGARCIQLAHTREASTPIDTKLATAFLDPIEIARLEDQERRSLARALPFLRRPRERLAEPLEPARAAQGRRVLLGELLARSCVRRDVPLLITVEDIQWARGQEQAALVDVLSAAHESGASILVVVTARRNSVDAIWGKLRPRFFRCDEFTPEESEAFARSLLGGLEALEGTSLHARLKESPASAMWVQESLRLASDRGVLRRSNSGFSRHGPLPAAALPVVLEARVAMLPIQARRIAAALATVGVDANLSDIADVSRRSANDVAVAIETLLRHGIARRASVGRSLGFRMHDRFVDTILKTTPTRTLRATRRRAAKLGERRALGAPEGLMRAAELYAAAERRDDSSRVLRRALDLADKEGRPDTGLLVLDQRRALGESFEQDDFLKEFDLSMRVGNIPRAEGALWQAERLNAAPPEAAWRRARLELREGEFAMARHRLQPHVESSEGSLRAELLLTLADVESADGNPAIARIAYDGAAHAAKEVKDARREARALLGRTQAEHRVRDPRASASALAASTAADRAKDPALQAHAKRQIGIALRQNGELVAAQRAFRSAMKTARNAGNIAAEADVLHELGHVARLRGQVADAVTALRRSIRLKHNAGLTHSARLPLVHLAALVRATGEAGLAADLINVISDDTDDAVRVIAGIVKGDLAVMRGEWRAALRHYSDSLEVSKQTEGGDADAHARYGAWRARLAVGSARNEEPFIEEVEELPEFERSRLITRALWLRDRDSNAALLAAKEAAGIRKPDGLFSTLFGSHLEAQWVYVLAQSWAGKSHASGLKKLQRRLAQLLKRYDDDAPRLMDASPIYAAIREGRISTQPGQIW